MNQAREILDMSDPYDAYAYLLCIFVCDNCNIDLLPDAGFEGCGDLECCHASDKAKALGWYVTEGLSVCYCPKCAKEKGCV